MKVLALVLCMAIVATAAPATEESSLEKLKSLLDRAKKFVPEAVAEKWDEQVEKTLEDISKAGDLANHYLPKAVNDKINSGFEKLLKLGEQTQDKVEEIPVVLDHLDAQTKQRKEDTDKQLETILNGAKSQLQQAYQNFDGLVKFLKSKFPEISHRDQE